jgi:hypothetical protein
LGRRAKAVFRLDDGRQPVLVLPHATRADGSRLAWHAAGRIVRRLAKNAGIDKRDLTARCGMPARVRG